MVTLLCTVTPLRLQGKVVSHWYIAGHTLVKNILEISWIGVASMWSRINSPFCLWIKCFCGSVLIYLFFVERSRSIRVCKRRVVYEWRSVDPLQCPHWPDDHWLTIPQRHLRWLWQAPDGVADWPLWTLQGVCITRGTGNWVNASANILLPGVGSFAIWQIVILSWQVTFWSTALMDRKILGGIQSKGIVLFNVQKVTFCYT